MYLKKRKKGQKTNDNEEVIYWRKVNAIHKWFAENVETNKEDLRDSRISIGKLECLLTRVNEVLDKSELVDGEINNGQTLINGEWKDIKQNGKYIKNPEIANDLLPTTRGFFFGSTDYDEYYVEDLKHTKKELEKVLSEVKEGDEYYYCASW